MFRSRLVLLLVMVLPLYAQRPQVPQSPRQALIEMLFSGTQAAFEKHLPDATKAAVEKSGIQTPGLLTYSGASLQMMGKAQGDNFQLFEAGPILVATRDPRTGQKFQVNIDRDDLMGDLAEMDLSFHTFKGEQEEANDHLLSKN